MNIRNFLSNMFSSSKKNRIDDFQVQQQSSRKSQDDHFVTLSSNQQQQEQPEEDLLSNLRKSKLFFDDMDIPKSPPKQSMNLAAGRLAPIDESSSNNINNNNNHSISQNSGTVQVKRTGLVPVSIDSIHLTTPSKLERQELQSFNQSRPNFSEFLNSLKKAKKMSAEKLVQQSPAAAPTTTTNSIFFDKRNQSQQQGSANAADEPIITSLGAVGRSSVRSFIEEAGVQQDNTEVSVSQVLGRIPSGRASGFTSNASELQISSMQQSHISTHPVHGTACMLTTPISGQIPNSTSSSIGNASATGVVPSTIFNRSSSQSSSKSSRVRGSSSKKKAMFPESPIMNGGNSMIGSNNNNNSMIKRADAMMIAEIPLTNVFGSTTLSQNVSSLQTSIVGVNYGSSTGFIATAMNDSGKEGVVNPSRFQAPSMLVKEDVDGENEALKADCGMEELIAIDGEQVGDDCESVENGFNSSKKYQQECMSTRAEPPTQMKNRSNSFYFDETPVKQQQSSAVLTNGVGIKQLQRSSSASNNSSKSMSIESPDRASYMSGIEGNAHNNNNNNSEGVSSFSSATAVAGTTKEIHSNKCLSEYKSRSSGSSPSRTSLNSFHKQFELIVDKSEIPPNGYLLKSAQKVPSPIKEVDEISQRNPIHQGRREYSREMEVLEEGNNGFIDRIVKQVIESPKMRQKSVKFDYVEQTPQNPNSSYTGEHTNEDGNTFEDNEQDGRGDSSQKNNSHQLHHHHSRVHDKLQSRKPTPYNPFKQMPGSYLSRQNKAANIEGDDADDEPECAGIGRISPIENSRTVLFRDNNKESENDSQRNSSTKSQNQLQQQQQSPNHDQNSSLHLRNNVFQQSAPQQQKATRNEDSNSLSRAIATTNKKPVKLPLALKKNDFAEQMKAASVSVTALHGAGNKKVVGGSHSNGFVRSESISGARNAGGVKKEVAKAGIAKEQVLSNGKVLTNKKKATGEHTVNLSEMVAVARIAHDRLNSETAAAGEGATSNPLPRSMQQSTPISGTAVKSAYKNCVFCQYEVKLKDEFKILPCGHKSHNGCQPKEKILRCPRCNSNNLSNKYRPKE